MDGSPSDLIHETITDGFEVVSGTIEPRLASVVLRITGFREPPNRPLSLSQPASLGIPLVIGFAEPFRIGLGRPPGSNERFGSFASGLFAGPVHIASDGGTHCLQIDFSPLAARRFFGCPMNELAGRMVGIDDVLGPSVERLRQRLGNTPSWTARFALASAFVAERLGRAAATERLAISAFRRIVASGGRIEVARLAGELDLSRGHLHQRFVEQFGIGPKQIARLVRFNTALRGIRHTNDGLADIAAACGYADQSHLTREVALLSGRTPAGWRRAAVAA
jgi:AraC-like DNA-binding protein